MPESPRYLSMRGNTTAAKEILMKFKIDERDVQSDLQLWTSTHNKVSYLTVFKEHFGITHAIPVFGLYIFEQLIGAVSILFYLHKIFNFTGKFEKRNKKYELITNKRIYDAINSNL